MDARPFVSVSCLVCNCSSMTGFSLSPTAADGVKVAVSAAAAAEVDVDDDVEDLLGRSFLPALFRASSYMRSFVSFEKQ